MLKNLYVKNLALIEEISIDFQEGLNILTGETGAGKSILIGSILLALGGRYLVDMLRTGAEYGYVELSFEIEDDKMEQELRAMDIFPEDHLIVLARRLMEGRSVSKINGETVTMAQLKKVASLLMDVHGQKDAQLLLKANSHRQLLDSYGGNELQKLRDKVKEDFLAYRLAVRKAADLDLDETVRLREQELLSFEVEELEQADLKPGEDEELETAFDRMLHGRKILESMSQAYENTGGNEGENASDYISRSLRSLGEVARHDENVQQLYEQLSEIDGLLNDFNRELSDYQQGVAFSEESFQAAEDRLNEINKCKQKYGYTIPDILEELEKKKERLFVLEDYEEQSKIVKNQMAEAEERLRGSSKKLTAGRQKVAAAFAKEIKDQLLDLNFLENGFDIQISPSGTYGEEGADHVEFVISMNPGEPLKSLMEVASGGELSRIMLAIKAAMADKEKTPTMIFDEIDAGISGRTAQMVSEKMAVIARNHQVICITHLAQIAAMADAHYLIEKQSETVKGKAVTTTKIQQLNPEESIGELSRILGGASITDTVVKSAMEMKEQATLTKKKK